MKLLRIKNMGIRINHTQLRSALAQISYKAYNLGPKCTFKNYGSPLINLWDLIKKTYRP